MSTIFQACASSICNLTQIYSRVHLEPLEPQVRILIEVSQFAVYWICQIIWIHLEFIGTYYA